MKTAADYKSTAKNRMAQVAAKDGRAPGHQGRFIAFRATSRAGRTKGRKIALPALLYSRPAALESLLSVALSSAGRSDCITLLFVQKMGSFSMNTNHQGENHE